MSNIAAIKDAEFEASAVIEGNAIIMRLWGDADLRVNGALGPFLASVDEEACRSGLGEVVADFRELVFMNSSCIKGFVHWLGTVQEREEAKQHRIRFLSDPAAHWQSRSLQALSAFAPKIVTVA